MRKAAHLLLSYKVEHPRASAARAMQRTSFAFLARLFSRRSLVSEARQAVSHNTSSSSSLASRRRFWQAPQFSTTVKMSGAGIIGSSATLYAVTTSPAQILGAKPKEAGQLKHHLQNGKGFVNPWDSFQDFKPWKLMFAMIM